MEPTLVAVTLASLVLATALGALTWRLVREERRRSVARVAMLRERADRDPSPSTGDRPPSGPVGSARTDGLQGQEVAPWELPLRNAVPPQASSLDGNRMNDGELFGSSSRPARHRNIRPFVFAGVGSAMALVLVVVWHLGTRARVDAPGAPLELVSLGHDRQDGSLRITGLVQNPRTGREVRDVVAVAFLFDRNGTFIASGRAPLDFVRLAPGDESPFVIIVPNAGEVARYRLGFRARDGRVLTHVDRRFDASATGRTDDAPHGSAQLKSDALRSTRPERE